jgi:hypothetical protein
MAQDRFDWLILLVAGAIASVLLLAMTAYNAIAGLRWLNVHNATVLFRLLLGTATSLPSDDDTNASVDPVVLKRPLLSKA